MEFYVEHMWKFCWMIHQFTEHSLHVYYYPHQ